MINEIICQRCKYSWKTTSIRLFVSCPNCLTKVKNEVKEDE